MADLKLFRNTDTGEVVSYPAHFGDHPVFGANLVAIDEETELDKVVTAGHELPVEQRSSFFVSGDYEDPTNDEDEEEDE